jgi:hypothetical protein
LRRALTFLASTLIASAALAAAAPAVPTVPKNQKGEGVLTVRAQPVAQPKPGKWRLVRLSGGGGGGLAVIPDRAEALIERTGTAEERGNAYGEISLLASLWSRSNLPGRLSVAREGDRFKIAAEGKAAPAADPQSGHNALGDLTAFLATLELRMDAWGALATFTGIAVGTETNGLSLGLAQRDPVLGDLTANLAAVREEKGVPVAEIGLQVPRGITKAFMEKQLADRTAAFTRRTGAALVTKLELKSEPRVVSAAAAAGSSPHP